LEQFSKDPPAFFKNLRQTLDQAREALEARIESDRRQHLSTNSATDAQQLVHIPCSDADSPTSSEPPSVQDITGEAEPVLADPQDLAPEFPSEVQSTSVKVGKGQ
jgi:hypothetical protein